MLTSHIFLAVFWMLYCLVHSILADPGIKKRMQKFLGKSFRYYRLGYTLFAFTGLILILMYQYRLCSPALFANSSLSVYGGWFLTIMGLVIMLICIKKYFLSLSGLLSLVHESPQAHLMIGGLHRYVRHPLYLGTFLAIWGFFLLVPLLSIVISNTIITVYTLIGIRLEERKLVIEFGDDYRKYQTTVPMILPFQFKRKTSPELS